VPAKWIKKFVIYLMAIQMAILGQRGIWVLVLIMYGIFFSGHSGYYPQKDETDYLCTAGHVITASFPETRIPVIIGPGPFLKEIHLIRHFRKVSEIHVVDVSAKYVKDAQESLAQYFNAISLNVPVHGHVCDFLDFPDSFEGLDGMTVMCTGGLISNLPRRKGELYPADELKRYLEAIRKLIDGTKDSHALIGYDTNPNELEVREAYNHPKFRAYIKNALFQAFLRSEGMFDRLDEEMIDNLFTCQTNVINKFGHSGQAQYPYVSAEHVLIAKEDINIRRGDGVHTIQKGQELVILISEKLFLPRMVQDVAASVGLRTPTVHANGRIAEHVLELEN
jgi:hypothetical protein